LIANGGDVHHDRVWRLPNDGWDDRILICRCGTLVDVFIVITTRYVVIVDTLIGPDTAEQLLAIARPYLRGGRTLLAIDTHADWDHCLGNSAFVGPAASDPAPVIATRSCAARFAAGEVTARLARLRAEEPERFAAVEPSPPTLLFDERLRIDGGDLTLELFRAPGHTADHLAILIPEIATLLVGDAAERPFPFAHSLAALPELRATLRTLDSLGARTILACHAPPEREPRLLRDNSAYFDTLEERCRRALAAGTVSAATPEGALEEAVGWPIGAAIGGDPDELSNPAMYRRGHLTHIRLMLEWLSGDTTS
jgi:glyoxylase-like metal-dependent hydrolase (beta-lactamase superfamily II)